MIDMNGGYMNRAYDPELVIINAREQLADVDYDTMVGTGVSGAIMVPQLARELGKNWLIIRKPTDKSHSDLPAEGMLGDRWIFVDDFIDFGGTKRMVLTAVEEIVKDYGYYATEDPVTYVGDYLYQRLHFYPAVGAIRPPQSFPTPEPSNASKAGYIAVI